MTHPRFVLDHNRCILCTRYVRACAELEGAHVWEIGGRGIRSRLVSDLNDDWGASDGCTSCGKCVQACPTGAITENSSAGHQGNERAAQISSLASRRAIANHRSH